MLAGRAGVWALTFFLDLEEPSSPLFLFFSWLAPIVSSVAIENNSIEGQRAGFLLKSRASLCRRLVASTVNFFFTARSGRGSTTRKAPGGEKKQPHF